MHEESETETSPAGAPNAGFEDFFRSTYPLLARAMYLLTGNATEADELAQEAMARAYERWDRISVMESPIGYVYRVAVNVRRRDLRAIARQAGRLFTGSPAADLLAVAESRVDLLNALQNLPMTQRSALILVDFLGLTSDDAGRILRVAAASVRGRLVRGRSALRNQLEETS